jgi:hypothetical protein
VPAVLTASDDLVAVHNWLGPPTAFAGLDRTGTSHCLNWNYDRAGRYCPRSLRLPSPRGAAVAALADAKLASDFGLGHLRGLADHGEVHRIDPVHLPRVSVSSSDVGGLEPGGHETLIVAATLGQPGTAGTILPNALRADHNLVLALDRALAPRRAVRFAS